MNSDICETCQYIFRTVRRSQSPQRFHYHPSWNSLQCAARECSVCAIIKNAFCEQPDIGYGEGLDNVEVEIDFSAPDNETCSIAKVELFWAKGPNELRAVKRFKLKAVPSSQIPIDPFTAQSSSTGSSLPLNRAVKWIEDCVNNHRFCPKSRDISFLPTRILDLGSTGDTSNIVLRERGEISKDARYVTLSHCWGGKLEMTLELSNLNSLRKEISPNDLSQTYLDAIKISRSIGIRYLWIDSLCIIQDSREDWEQECVLMSHVYANSLCNIAASAASDGTQGCFISRDWRLVNPCKVRIPSFDNGVVCHTYEFIHDHSMDWKYLDRSPLNQRAWVVQERLLSPRVLHFGPQQLLWECDELTASESFPFGDGLTKGTEYRLQRALCSHPWASRSLGALVYWGYIVRTYSKCLLSIESDRVIALSGVVRRFGMHINDSCIVGMWVRHLELQLCWRVWNPSRARLSIAPTWSWLSIYGEVAQDVLISMFNSKSSLEDDTEAWLLSTVTDRRDLVNRANIFGEINGSRAITIRCFMFSSHWDMDQHFPSHTDVMLGSVQPIATIYWDVSRDLSGTRYWLVPIFVHQGTLYGLVLEGCSTPKESFKRLGCFQSNWKMNEERIRTACSKSRTANNKAEVWSSSSQEKQLLLDVKKLELMLCDSRYLAVITLV
ncbi:heterokaryon incompatibility protein-domain-containing protein [Paraphoma chrysanthemicola]|nr:heterokaryon incompatibility protein-domain-containing protein [Paraphoma chrysanthemicola]